MKRRTFAEVAAAAREIECGACVEMLRDKIAEVDVMVVRNRVTALEGDLLKRRLDAVADAMVAGLHR